MTASNHQTKIADWLTFWPANGDLLAPENIKRLSSLRKAREYVSLGSFFDGSKCVIVLVHPQDADYVIVDCPVYQDEIRSISRKAWQWSGPGLQQIGRDHPCGFVAGLYALPVSRTSLAEPARRLTPLPEQLLRLPRLWSNAGVGKGGGRVPLWLRVYGEAQPQYLSSFHQPQAEQLPAVVWT